MPQGSEIKRPNLLRTFSRSERGVALIVTMLVLMVSGTLAAVAASSAVEAGSQASRDSDAKRALAAADAGVELGIYHVNKLAGTLTDAAPCPVPNAVSGALEPGALEGAGWCPPEGEDLGEGASVSYRVSSPARVDADGQDVWQRKIVATGVADGVRRRAVSIVHAPTGTALFADTVFSHEDLVLRNSSQVVGGVRSNGNVVTQNSATVCGNIVYGPGKEFRGSGQCGGYGSGPASEPFVLSPVALPESNDNGRIGSADLWTEPERIGWSSSTRMLEMEGTSTLTLTGENYVLCSLVLRNSARIIVPDDGTPVRIYIDSPENCGSGAGSFALYNSSTIENVSGDPSMVQLYVAGSGSSPTYVQFHNLHQLAMAVYAPNSFVSFDNNNTFRGALAARRVTMQNNLEIRWDPRLSRLYVGDVPVPVYSRQAWVECSLDATGGEPDAGC